MTIRRYEPADCEDLAKLFYHTVHAVNAKDYSQEQLDAWASGETDLDAWNKSLSGHYTVVAVENNIITGFGDIDKSGYLDRLYVHKDFQRRGVATAICDELERAVKVPKIITHSSITARPFFEQRGFCVVKEQQVVRNGIALTNYVMEKQARSNRSIMNEKQNPEQAMFEIRHSTEDDFPEIMKIYEFARGFMAKHGNPNQWGPTKWPPEDLIHSDIAEGKSYVCLHQNRIVGTFFFDQGANVEPAYKAINDGNWTDDSDYGVIHRLAGNGAASGVGRFCIEWAFAKCGHLRIDTHVDNAVMQNLLKKCGFAHCGTIYVEEDDFPRMAFEKTRGGKKMIFREGMSRSRKWN